MGQANGSARKLGYVFETVPGTTPNTPAFKELPVVSFDLSSEYDALKSNTVRAGRTPSPSRRGNATLEGQMVVEAQADTYDDFLKMAMLNEWATNSLSIGTTLQTVAIEEGYDFGSNDIDYRVFNGVTVNTMGIEVGTDDQVEITFGLIGLTETEFTGTSADASGYTATPTKDFFFHVDGEFLENGAPIGYLSSISLELNNNVTGNRALGTDGYRNVTPGEASVSGSIGGLLENTALFNKLRDNETTTLSLTLSNASESLTFTMNGVKLTNGRTNVASNEGVTFEFDFEASGTNALVITRV